MFLESRIEMILDDGGGSTQKVEGNLREVSGMLVCSVTWSGCCLLHFVRFQQAEYFDMCTVLYIKDWEG